MGGFGGFNEKKKKKKKQDKSGNVAVVTNSYQFVEPKRIEKVRKEK